MKTGSSGPFDRKKYPIYSKHKSQINNLCKKGYGVEICNSFFIVRSIVECPKTHKKNSYEKKVLHENISSFLEKKG